MQITINYYHILFWGTITYTFLWLINKIVTDYIAIVKADKAFIREYHLQALTEVQSRLINTKQNLKRAEKFSYPDRIIKIYRVAIENYNEDIKVLYNLKLHGSQLGRERLVKVITRYLPKESKL